MRSICLQRNARSFVPPQDSGLLYWRGGGNAGKPRPALFCIPTFIRRSDGQFVRSINTGWHNLDNVITASFQFLEQGR